tara:strand:+ start:1672 stop:2430 length:759 start_codon:yes stop_codon:yes gene_type:complete
MSRLQIFQKCNPKMPIIENFVSGNPEYKLDVASSENIPLSFFIGRGEGGVFGSVKNGPTAIINVQEKHGAHAVIFVKSKFLKNGWGLFDPNGSRSLPFKIIHKGENVTKDYLEPNIPFPINYGSDSINPGYCGTYGVIFMIFLRFNITNNNWIQEWINILNKFSIKSGKTNKGIEFSAQVQKLISEISNLNTLVTQIHYNLESFMENDPPSSKRQRTSFGKNKYKHNDREYSVHIGPRGGRYIIVKNVKKYI